DDGVAHGMMSRHDDVDVFRLPMLEGLNTVKVELTGVPRTDLVLSLLDRNGERLARADEHGLAAGERLSIAINARRVAQPLYLQVTSFRGSDVDTSYRL